MEDWPLPAGHIRYSVEYEEIEARRHHGETFASWHALEQAERSYLIAAYRSHTQLRAVLADEHNKEVKAANRKKGK